MTLQFLHRYLLQNQNWCPYWMQGCCSILYNSGAGGWNPGRCPGLYGHCAFSAPFDGCSDCLNAALRLFGIALSARRGCGGFRNAVGGVGGNFVARGSGSLSGCFVACMAFPTQTRSVGAR